MVKDYLHFTGGKMTGRRNLAFPSVRAHVFLRRGELRWPKKAEFPAPLVSLVPNHNIAAIDVTMQYWIAFKTVHIYRYQKLHQERCFRCSKLRHYFLGMDKRSIFFREADSGLEAWLSATSRLLSVMSARKEKISGRPSAEANTLKVSIVQEWGKGLDEQL